MRRMGRRMSFYLTTMAVCFVFMLFFKAGASAATYTHSASVGSNGTMVGISISGPYGYTYDIKILNRKGKVVKQGSCTSYTSFSVKKNSVYFYKIRPKYYNYYTGYSYGNWTKKYAFTTIRGNRYKLKIRSKSNRTVSLKVPKIKGVSAYNVYISNTFGAVYKKVKKAKPGQTVILKRFNGSKFAYNVYYYVKVIPKVKGKEAQGIRPTGSFRFTKIYRYRYRYRIVRRYYY